MKNYGIALTLGAGLISIMGLGVYAEGIGARETLPASAEQIRPLREKITSFCPSRRS